PRPDRDRVGDASRRPPRRERPATAATFGKPSRNSVMRNGLPALWTLLEHSPLFWLATTLLAFGFGQAMQRGCRRSPLANPVLIAILLMAALLEATATPYQTYSSQVTLVTFLLG